MFSCSTKLTATTDYEFYWLLELFHTLTSISLFMPVMLEMYYRQSVFEQFAFTVFATQNICVKCLCWEYSEPLAFYSKGY